MFHFRPDKSQISITIGLALIPLITSLSLLFGMLRADLGQYVPTFSDIYNDSIYHWRQAYTFSATGFNGGYYTINELAAPVSFSHFYHHGPGYPVLYGTLGKLTGWQLTSSLWLNMALVTLALVILQLGIPLTFRQRITSSLIVIAVFPVLIYMATSMAESLHHAGAILLACLCWRLIAERNLFPLRPYLFLLAVITALTLTRPTWGILFIPVLLLRAPRWSLGNILLYSGIGAVCFVALYALHTLMIAPYPFLDKSLGLENGLIGAIQLRLDRLNLNLEAWNRGIPVEIAQRYIVAALLPATGVLWIVRRRAFSAEAILHLANLGLPLAINLFANDMTFYRDFRAMAPHLLLSLLVLIACRRWLIPAVFLALQVVMLPQFLTEYRATVEPQFTPGLVEQITSFRDQTREILVYDPAAPSAWCNTLLFVMENRGNRVLSIPPELALVDPGIGLSFYIGYWGETAPLTYPIRSHYLLLSEGNRALIGDNARLTLLVNTAAGGVYQNEGAEC